MLQFSTSWLQLPTAMAEPRAVPRALAPQPLLAAAPDGAAVADALPACAERTGGRVIGFQQHRHAQQH